MSEGVALSCQGGKVFHRRWVDLLGDDPTCPPPWADIGSLLPLCTPSTDRLDSLWQVLQFTALNQAPNG